MRINTRILPIIPFCLSVTHNAFAETDDKSGIYEVNQAFLNLKHCDVKGKPVDYASQYINLKKMFSTNEKYRLSTCDGESLDEVVCNGRFNSSILERDADEGFTGYRFGAQKSTAKDGTPQCLLTALRRTFTPLKGEFIQYERADWGTLLADYAFECTDEMAKEFFEAQSLKCSSYIVIDARRVKQND